jgi:hypothetical protein
MKAARTILASAEPLGVALASQLDATAQFAFQQLDPRERKALAAILRAAADQLVPPTVRS